MRGSVIEAAFVQRSELSGIAHHEDVGAEIDLPALRVGHQNSECRSPPMTSFFTDTGSRAAPPRRGPHRRSPGWSCPPRDEARLAPVGASRGDVLHLLALHHAV